MFQMKEQEKTLQKELNEMERSNLFNKGFEEMIINKF